MWLSFNGNVSVIKDLDNEYNKKLITIKREHFQ